MNNNRFLLISVILMLFIISISSVSAGETNTAEDLTIDEEIAIDNGDSINLNNNEETNLILNNEENTIVTSNEKNVDNNDENNYMDNEIEINSKNSLSSSILNDSRNITVDTKTFSAIQSAVDSANDGDTIILSGTYSYDLGGDIVVNKTLEIIGINNAILDANNKTRIFNVTSNVIIKNISFKNGNEKYGAAIYVDMGAITCDNCTFIKNYANYGGAIYFYSNIVSNIQNCSFINNHGWFYCGALYCAYLQNGPIPCSAVNCSFDNNHALYEGGAMYGGSAVNCSFVNNHVEARSGGAMYGGSAVNCSFVNNFATNGGAIYGGSAVNCSFVNNSAEEYGGALNSGNAIDCTFINNYAGEYGGAMAHKGRNSISNCTFINNSAGIGGGSIHYNGYELYQGDRYNGLNIFNCNLINCTGNGIISLVNVSYFNLNNTNFTNVNCSSSLLVFDTVQSVNFFNDSFVNCSFNVNGTILNLNYTISEIINMSSCTFENNSFNDKGLFYSTRRDIYFDNCSFINNDFDSKGMVLVDGTSSCNLVNCHFKENTVSNGTLINLNKYKFPYGGCDFINNTINNGSLISVENDLSNIINFTFENNSIIKGCLIDFKANNSSLTNCSFIHNNASDGAALSFENVALCNLVDCYFELNTASNRGSDIYSTNSSININNCSFNGNSTGRGDGIIAAESNSNINISNSNFKNYRVLDNSGVFYSAQSTFCIDNSNFSGNDGGIIIIDYDSTVNLTNSNFTNNTDSSNKRGSAIRCLEESNNVFVFNTQFYGNRVSPGAGILAANSNNLTVLNSSFINNYALSGGVGFGGIYINCSFVNNSAMVCGAAITNGTAINCSFINNSAEYSGGAISQSNAINCTFINNSANEGGAIGYVTYFQPDDSYEISNCIFINNTASKWGSAIHATFDVNVSISNCSFINNTANEGGAIYLNNANLNISDCSFINNSANNSGGAIFVHNASLNISNSSFENISCNGSGAAIYIENATGVSVNHCDFVNCVSGEGSESIVTDDTQSLDVSDCVFDVIPEGITVYYDSILIVDDLSFAIGANGILVANLSDVRGPLVGKTITLTVNGNDYINTTDSNGLAKFNMKNYFSSVGNYTVTVSFAGDETIGPNSTNVNVSIFNYKGVLSVSSSGKYYNDVNVSFRLYNMNTILPIPDANIHIVFSNGEIVNLTTGSDGSVSYVLPFAPGTYNLTATVEDDNVDVASVSLTDISISRIVGKIDVTQAENVLNIRLFNQNTGEVYRNVDVNLQFNVTDAISLTTNDQGIASYDMTELGFGTYSAIVTVLGDYKEFNAEILSSIEVKNYTHDKTNSQVSFSGPIVFDYGKTGSVTVAVVGGVIELKNIKVDGHPEAKITIGDKVIKVSGLKLGTYTLHVKTTPDDDHYSVSNTIGITVRKVSAALKASNNAVYYKENKKWTIKLIDTRTKKPIAKKTIVLKVYTGKKYKTIKLTTNAKGIASIKASTWAIGKHKVVISFSNYGHTCKNLVRYVTVKKRIKLTYETKTEAMVDGSNLFVWAKKGKKPINKVKLRVLVYTGKKYKEYDLVTGDYKSDGKVRKGFIGYGTNMLSVGKHKIVIKPYAYKYTGTKTTYMTIKKSAKKYKQSQVFVSNGKRSMNY